MLAWFGLVTLIAIAGTARAHPAVTRPCAACHEDAHHGELGARCASCHTLAAWVPSTFGPERHTKFPLEGRHVATPCGGCHGARPRKSFVVPSHACLDCHLNPHETRFAKEMIAGGCAGCHTAGNWNAWKVDHHTWPLTGGHERVACAACHPGTTAESPPAAFRGVPRACERCHADTHAGQFATAPERTCTSCHTTESFRAPFDHAKTRFALGGAHATIACTRCHLSTTLRNGATAVRWRLGYAACGDCHANPHPRTTMACDACHGTTRWGELRAPGSGFDHATTGFPLHGAHAVTSCSGCHAAAGRPSTECESCHRDTHAGRLPGRCAECHTAVAWSDTRTLEQHRRTRMPLTGKHAVIECVACHYRGGGRTWSDVPPDCYGCHAQAYRDALPDHDGAMPDSRDCVQCHFTAAWKPAFMPSMLRVARDHTAFPLRASHRAAECSACHVDARRRDVVRCDACHTADALRSQHRARVTAQVAADCLRCHPRGARR